MESKIKKVAPKTRKPTKEEEATAGQLRWKLSMVLNCLVAALGVILSAVTFLSVNSAKKYLQFVEGFDDGNILMIAAVEGFISALVGLFGASLCSLSTSEKKYRRIRFLVFAYLGWGGVLFVLTGVSSGLIYVTVGNLDVVFKPGFTESLIKYQKEAAVKESIDAVQEELKCCGNFNYTEWFTALWMDAASKADVKIPKSCCDREATAAQKILCETSVPFAESIRLTPYAKGCVPLLMEFYGQLLTKVTYILAAIAIITIAIVFMVYFESRDPSEMEKAQKEIGNLPKKQGGAAPAMP